MRVLAIGNVYPPHQLGGYEVIWQGVTRHLLDTGHAARVLTTTYRDPALPTATDGEPDVHRELDWYWREHAWPRLGLAARVDLERHNGEVLDRHLAEFEPEVVAWWPMGGMSLSLFERVRRAGVPSVVFVLDPWPVYGPQRDLWTRMWRRGWAPARLAERLTGLPTRVDVAAPERWVFCSRSMRDTTLAAGLPVRSHKILAPGVDEMFLRVAPEPQAPAWGWRLLYLGRVVEQKGVRTAIECLSQLPVEATLRIIGPGDRPYRRELDELTDQLGVRDRVCFEGPLPRAELPAAYRAADVVLFPVMWDEPWGLVPLEAMALGRPIVATGRGGSGDYLVDGVNSLLFEAGDAEGLASSVAALAQSGPLRERLQEGGRATAEQHSAGRFNRLAAEEIRLAAAGAPPASPFRSAI